MRPSLPPEPPGEFEENIAPHPSGELPIERRPAREFNLRGRTLRQHAARGTLINSAFLVALTVLQTARGFIMAAFLTREDYGVYGVLAVSLGTLLILKNLGVGDKYVQQDEEDQEVAFQKAWSMEALLTGAAMTLLLVAIGPLVLFYGEPKLLLPGLMMILTLPAGLLQMPVFVYYRRMEFLRQRTLQAIEPVVAFVVGIGLAIAGAGYWALFIGTFAGAYAAGIASMIHAPYRVRFRYDRGTLQEYWSFSWPLLASAAGGLVMAQSSIVAAELKLGLAGAGTLTLAQNITVFTQRISRLVTGSLYPAIAAIRSREVLVESFVKSNRLALLWGMPFGFGLMLFSGDLVTFVIGDHWRPVVVLLQVYGITAAIGQIGFNWDAYLRAANMTRPLAWASAASTIVFLLTAIPLMFASGLRGFAVGVLLQTLVNLGFRAFYLGRLFDGFAFARHALRGLATSVPALLAIGAMRLLEPTERTATIAVSEIVVYGILTAAATIALERTLLREVLGYIRARPQPAAG